MLRVGEKIYTRTMCQIYSKDTRTMSALLPTQNSNFSKCFIWGTSSVLKIMAGQHCHNRACDPQNALFNGHHDRQYLDVATTFTDFNSFTTFSKTIFTVF